MSAISPSFRETFITRAHPIAKLGATLIITIPLLLSIDVVSAAVALGLELLLFPWWGISAVDFAKRSAPLWIGAFVAGFSTIFFGKDSGTEFLQWGIINVSEGSLWLALAIFLRVVAIGLPGIVLLASTDPTDLADGMGQVLHLPARFVVGALAGLRLIGLLMDDWRMLMLARRARGLGDSSGLFGKIRVLVSQAFGLFVIALRRGSKLATAMEARGFGTTQKRTWARPSALAAPDFVFLGVSLLLACLAVSVAVWAGSWSLLFA